MLRPVGSIYAPFETWGIVVEAIAAGGPTAPLHRSREFYAKAIGQGRFASWEQHLDKARADQFCQIDANRLTYFDVQGFLELEYGRYGVWLMAKIFALQAGYCEQSGARLWSMNSLPNHEKGFARMIAKKYHSKDQAFATALSPSENRQAF